jgi:hypothetical protein
MWAVVCPTGVIGRFVKGFTMDDERETWRSTCGTRRSQQSTACPRTARTKSVRQPRKRGWKAFESRWQTSSRLARRPGAKTVRAHWLRAPRHFPDAPPPSGAPPRFQLCTRRSRRRMGRQPAGPQPLRCSNRRVSSRTGNAARSFGRPAALLISINDSSRSTCSVSPSPSGIASDSGNKSS